jgi:transcriptional regulator GlxA family with amidase domain
MTSGANQARRHVVVALLLDGFSPFELGVVCEVFGTDHSAFIPPWYQLVLAAVEPGPVRSDLGFDIDVSHGLDALRRADTVFLMPRQPSQGEPPQAVLEALRAAHARGARMASVCTGAFTLAAAGLLDDRRATTHWLHVDALRATYPKVVIDPDVLYVDEGDVLTSAGTAAAIDLCLHLVRADFGAAAANALARRMVVPPHRDGGQAQFIAAPEPACDDDAFGAVLAWALRHLDQPLDVGTLADRAGFSPRHFSRVFRARTGTSPLRWLLYQRVLLARELLETTDDPVEKVARTAGFAGATSMRPHFQRQVRCSPAAYRRAFRRGPSGVA